MGYQIFLGQDKEICTIKKKVITGLIKKQQKQKLLYFKRQDTDWEKICAKHVSDKGLVSRIYKEHSKFNKKKKKKPQ